MSTCPVSISLSTSTDSPIVAAVIPKSSFLRFSTCCFRMYSRGLTTTTDVLKPLEGCNFIILTFGTNWYMTLLPHPVRSTAKTSSFKQTIVRMHTVCSSFNDFGIKSSRDEVRAAKNSLFASPSAAAIIVKLHRKSNMQSRNQLERGSRNLLFFDQLDKSPESGLGADESCSNCIRRCFFLPSLDRRLSRCHTFALPEKRTPDRRLMWHRWPCKHDIRVCMALKWNRNLDNYVPITTHKNYNKVWKTLPGVFCCVFKASQCFQTTLCLSGWFTCNTVLC